MAFAGDGGITAASNLYGVCVHHHQLKHDAPGWSVRQDPDGRITWSTPTGRSYSSDPHDYRVEGRPDLIAHVVAEVERRRARPPDRPPPTADTGPPPF
ncbi:hypothetical protein [Pseudonocardia lacus]|uniref:hypothetical protein n=1 Tax=Pseudonocardia lacus TaxID=2835865 RepID=UPI001BDCD398|nr:hypothetical protein [Pseudonocardia lacus]